MDRDLLVHLPVVEEVARQRGFAAAAKRLGMSASAVSHAVRQVEDRLGQPIFARTTRSVALTEAGEAFLALATPALRQIGEAWELGRVSGPSGMVTGTLRVTVSDVAFAICIAEIVAEVTIRHPALCVDLKIENALQDIIETGFDAGVRLGEMISEDMVAQRVTGPFQAMMVASPDYLDRHGMPRDLSELAEHRCIGYRLPGSGAVYRWDLLDGTRDVSLEAPYRPLVSSALAALEFALAGLGIAYVMQPLAATHLAAGRLRAVLPEAAITEPGLFLYYPVRAARAPKLAALVEAARGFERRWRRSRPDSTG